MKYNFIKCFCDYLFAWLFFIILSPFVLLVLILVAAGSEGTPIYKDLRVGKDFKPFKLLKIRTMYTNSPRGFVSDNDNRVTPIGKILRKTSLDELLQLVNIMKGDMSFIGPRPDLIKNSEKYNSDEKIRLSVKPGITGLAQVKGRNAIPWKVRYKYDQWYVNHLSLSLDLRILLATLDKVVKMENINK